MTGRADVGFSYWFTQPSANPTPVCRRSGCGKPALDDGEWCAHDQAVIDAVRQQREASSERWRQYELSMGVRGARRGRRAN